MSRLPHEIMNEKYISEDEDRIRGWSSGVVEWMKAAADVLDLEAGRLPNFG